MTNPSDNWTRYYANRIAERKLYPTEWVLRTLAGSNYAQLNLNRSDYCGAKILDLGCGDGRNLGLLQDLGFTVHATEISDDTVSLLKGIQQDMGWNVEFRRGINTDLPYEDEFFEYVLSCWSFYYLEADILFSDVLSETARIIKNNGFFIAVIPDRNNSVLRDAILLQDGSMIIQNDPLGIRNGTRWMVANCADEVRNILSPYFKNLHIGHLADDYFGLVVSGFIFVCRKR